MLGGRLAPKGLNPAAVSELRDIKQTLEIAKANADSARPPFMDHAWLGNGAGYVGDELCQQWFVHIGTGNNIRKADGLPFPLTKLMAHHFLQAPAELLPWPPVGRGGRRRSRRGRALPGLRRRHRRQRFGDPPGAAG